MEFGQLVSNEKQQARFKTMSTLKMIYIGCSMKGAILLLFQWSTFSVKFPERKNFSSGMWVAKDKAK